MMPHNWTLQKKFSAYADPTYLEVNIENIIIPNEVAETHNNYFSCIGEWLEKHLPIFKHSWNIYEYALLYIFLQFQMRWKMLNVCQRGNIPR